MVLAIIAISPVLLFGCDSKAQETEYRRELQAFAAAYHTYADSQALSPANLDDLRPYWHTFPQVREDIQAGQFIVFFDVALEKTAEENDRYVLGYEADVPEHGGLVLLGGGSVRRVTPEEFAKLRRFKRQGEKPH
jgi:hypothetical protein